MHQICVNTYEDDSKHQFESWVELFEEAKLGKTLPPPNTHTLEAGFRYFGIMGGDYYGVQGKSPL